MAQRNADKSRRAILEAAEALFAEYGPDGVSLAQIGQRAGVSRGLPSYFFSDKETLYRTVLQQAAAELRFALTTVIQTTPDTPPADVLLRLVDSYMDYLAAHPSIVRLLQWNSLESTREPRANWASRIPAELFDEVLRSFSKRIGSKTLRGIELQELLLSLVSMCLYPFQIRQMKPRGLRRRKQHIRTLVARMLGECR